MKPEDFRADSKRPFTGAEYLKSLQDSREIYIYGERVKDVTTHPAFRNAAASVGQLYDALHDPASQDRLCWNTDTGNGGYTHKFFRYARSPEEMRQQRDAIADWSRQSYGWMGRTPDYKAAFGCALGAYPEFYGQFADNARHWYKRIQETGLYFNHAIVNPPIDRHKPVNEVKDVYIQVEKETDAGIVVSGAKVVATNSALTHYNFIGFGSAQVMGDNPDFALMFVAPMDAEGVKLISRASYELVAGATGSPFDYPLTSRFDENDAILIMDHVLIPWENVLIYRDFDRCRRWSTQGGFARLFPLQACVRLADYVIPALEIIDARSHNVDPETQRPRKVFDTISDNAANAGVVMGGRPIKPDALDLRWISALLYRNGVIEESGVAAAVLNHPANGVAWLANKLAPYEVELEAGQVILGGSFTRPVPARRGDTFHVDYGPMGCISCRFV